MRVVGYESVEWVFVDNPRQGRIEFKQLLAGEEGDANNYALVIGRIEPDFVSPRHRHHFDQVRIALQGPTNIGPRLNILPGDLAYFPEGCHYGPQNQAETGETALSLVVQFGGASGAGYMSMAQMSRGARELATQGSFEGGVFRHAQDDARPRNRDGYEAVWSHVNGRELAYPKPRYGAPVFIHPQACDWQALADQPGVRARHLASFTEKDVRLSQVAQAAGAVWQVDARHAPSLLFALAGEGRASNAADWRTWTAIDIPAGESPRLQATADTVWFRLVLPDLRGTQSCSVS